jgi:hypothetical protein
MSAKQEWRRTLPWGTTPSNDRSAYFHEAQTVMFNQYAQWEEEQQHETWTAAEWQQHQWEEQQQQASPGPFPPPRAVSKDLDLV